MILLVSIFTMLMVYYLYGLGMIISMPVALAVEIYTSLYIYKLMKKIELKEEKKREELAKGYEVKLKEFQEMQEKFIEQEQLIKDYKLQRRKNEIKKNQDREAIDQYKTQLAKANALIDEKQKMIDELVKRRK